MVGDLGASCRVCTSSSICGAPPDEVLSRPRCKGLAGRHGGTNDVAENLLDAGSPASWSIVSTNMPKGFPGLQCSENLWVSSRRLMRRYAHNDGNVHVRAQTRRRCATYVLMPSSRPASCPDTWDGPSPFGPACMGAPSSPARAVNACVPSRLFGRDGKLRRDFPLSAKGGAAGHPRSHDLALPCTGGGGQGALFPFPNLDPVTATTPSTIPIHAISPWPNFHSGAMAISISSPWAPSIRCCRSDSPTGAIRYLPAHPHEGRLGRRPDEKAR
jgi:hypothetical protein